MAARIIGGLGRILVGFGLLLLLFAGFQLWGTGVAEARAQDDLTSRFRSEHALALKRQADRAAPTVVTAAGDTAQIADSTEIAGTGRSVETAGPSIADSAAVDLLAALRRDVAPVGIGEPVALLHIPAIGVSKTVVEGTTRDALRSGPGHYGPTPLPGRPGNAAVAGHRTTHGAPFFDIDLLQPGDEINVETLEGDFTYVVEGHDDGSGQEVGHLIVDPEEVDVIADKGDTRLTLTACDPKYSAKRRIIVTAVLRPDDPDPAAGSAGTDASPIAEALDSRSPQTVDAIAWVPEGQPDPLANRSVESSEAAAATAPPSEPPDETSIAESLGWQRDYAGPTLIWIGLTGLVGLAGWLLGRCWRRWPAYAMTVPPFGLALFYCFANLERFLPAV